jgi:hypothetical protein
MTETDRRAARDHARPPSAWATGGVVFAAVTMTIVGIFQFFEGLAAVIDDQFYVVLPNYAFDVDVTAWGWIHLIIGALVAIAGLYLLAGSAMAGMIAIVLAGVAAVSNFFFIPYYPLWSLLIVALSIYVIWAITRSGIFDA